MSKVCKMLVASIDSEAVEEVIYKHATHVHVGQMSVEESVWPIADPALFLSDDVEPTIFSLKVLEQKFVEIQYNSFGKNRSLSKNISQALNTQVVVNIYQSVTEACYWAFYDNGEEKRVIEFGDGQLLQNDGAKLPFENQPLGYNIGEEISRKEFYVFDMDDMERYNHHVGIEALVYHEFGEGWKMIRCVPLEKIKGVGIKWLDSLKFWKRGKINR